MKKNIIVFGKITGIGWFVVILTLISVGERTSIEPLVLDLINQGNNIKQDLLILLKIF